MTPATFPLVDGLYVSYSPSDFLFVLKKEDADLEILSSLHRVSHDYQYSSDYTDIFGNKLEYHIMVRYELFKLNTTEELLILAEFI